MLALRALQVAAVPPETTWPTAQERLMESILSVKPMPQETTTEKALRLVRELQTTPVMQRIR